MPPRANLPKRFTDLLAELSAKKKNRFFGVRYITDCDLNGGGRKDVVVAGSGAYGGDNLGRYLIADAQGKLTDQTQQIGLPADSVPILLRDLNGDGHVDVITAVGPTAGLYLNDGKGRFTLADNSLVAFLKKGGPYMLRAMPVDLDNDADMDLVLSNPRYGREQIHENLGGGRFRLVATASGWDSDPIAICDLNNDGLLDVAIGGPGGHKSTAITIYLNATKDAGAFCRILPRMAKPNWAAIGAVIEVFAAGTMGSDTPKLLLKRKANIDGSGVHVGLGAAKTLDIRVTFPGGIIVEKQAVAALPALTVSAEEAGAKASQ